MIKPASIPAAVRAASLATGGPRLTRSDRAGILVGVMSYLRHVVVQNPRAAGSGAVGTKVTRPSRQCAMCSGGFAWWGPSATCASELGRSQVVVATLPHLSPPSEKLHEVLHCPPEVAGTTD